MRTRYPISALILALPACGLAEKRHLTGNYYLVAENVPEQMKVTFNLNPGVYQSHLRIPETVYAVGWDRRYLVAMQHPKGNRSITNYYYLEIAKDYQAAPASKSVTGPLKEAAFKRKQAELGLPEFRLVIDPLR